MNPDFITVFTINLQMETTSYQPYVITSVMVNSSFRNKVLYPNAATFSVQLPKTLRNVKSAKIRDFFTYPNVAEYLLLYIRQLKGSILSNVVESAATQYPAWTVHFEDTLAKETLHRTVRHTRNTASEFCIDIDIPTLTQLDIEVWGRVNVPHAVPLAAPMPLELFPFDKTGGEWACVIDFEHTLY